MPEYLVTVTYRIDADDDADATVQVLVGRAQPDYVEVTLVDDPAESGREE